MTFLFQTVYPLTASRPDAKVFFPLLFPHSFQLIFLKALKFCQHHTCTEDKMKQQLIQSSLI